MKKTLILLLLLALPAAADHLWMEPVAPAPGTPIVFFLNSGCGSVQSIARAGAVITIRMTNGPCSPPRTWTLAVPLPEKTLPAGDYRVELIVNQATEPSESIRFVVSPGHTPDQPFHVHPAVTYTSGGARLYLRASAERPLCVSDQCEVFIDGVRVAHTRTTDGDLLVSAPQHAAAGFVNVTVTRAGANADREVESPLYYHSPSTDPLPSLFERVLFPIQANFPGANGSDWRTETTIANKNAWAIDNVNNLQPIVCITFPCGERIDPGGLVRLDGGEYPHGVALLVPRAEADYLSFSVRARDVSQDATNFGSELPVVREQQMVREGAATLLDIPVDDRYRVKVRLYAFDDTTNDTMQVRFTTELNGVRTTGALRTLQRTCQADGCAWTPYYGEVDLPAGAADARLNVYVDDVGAVPALVWAMASVTNNKTQQVTIVSARGASDVCRNCTQ